MGALPLLGCAVSLVSKTASMFGGHVCEKAIYGG